MLSKLPIGNSHKLVIATEGDVETKITDLRDLSQLADARPNLVGLIENSLEHELPALFYSISEDSNKDQIFLLTERHQLPKYSGWEQGELTSFISSWDLFHERLDQVEKLSHKKWAYFLISEVYELKIKPKRLEVIQLPLATPKGLPDNDNKIHVILPHKGLAKDLEACLHSLESNPSSNYNVMVGFDDFEESPSQYRKLMETYDQCDFYQSEPSRTGPFVLREHLINELDDGLVLYQDSDDLSTSDRFDKLTKAITDNDQMIGSHEVVFDEIAETLKVRRFPLDVNLALKSKPAFPLLHSTAMTTVEGFRKVGGYSTDRKFANDTQFLYRCYFHLRIRNLDEFLYIRKIHKKSLTNVADHPLDGALRNQIGDTWRNDFIEVMNDRKELDETSLLAIKKANTCIVPLNKKVKEIKSPV